MAEALAGVPPSDEDNGDSMDKEELWRKKQIFPNGRTLNVSKANTGDLTGRTNNVLRPHLGSVGSSLHSDSDSDNDGGNDNDSDSSSGNEMKDKTGSASGLNVITDGLSSVSISTTTSLSKFEMRDSFIKALDESVSEVRPRRSSCSSSSSEEDLSESDSDNEETSVYLSRGLDKHKSTSARVAAAPYHDHGRKAHVENRSGRDQNNYQLNDYQFNNSLFFETNFELPQESDTFSCVTIGAEYIDAPSCDVGVPEWSDSDAFGPNTMTNPEELLSSCHFESVPDHVPVSPSITVSSDDSCGTDNFNCNLYSSATILSPDSGISVDGDRSSPNRATRLSLDSDISEICNAYSGNSRSSLSPCDSFTYSSNSSPCNIPSVSPRTSPCISPCISPNSSTSYDYSMPGVSGIGAGSSMSARSVSPRNIVSPSANTSHDYLMYDLCGIGADGELQYSPVKMNIVNGDVISTSRKDKSQLFTANKLTGSGGTTIIKPPTDDSRVSQTLKSLGSPNISVFNYDPVSVTVPETLSNRPVVSNPDPIDEAIPVSKAYSKTSRPVSDSRISRESISELMMERDSLKDVFRYVRTDEITYRVQQVSMLMKIKELEKEGMTDKVLYKFLIDLSSVFGIEDSSIGKEAVDESSVAKQADNLIKLWKFQLVALIHCIMQYLKKPELFTMAHSYRGPHLFTPVQAAAIFNCKEPLVASCIADCVLVFTKENPDEKMLFSLQGGARPSLLYLLYQIDDSHEAVRAQLEKIKMRDNVTPAFSLHIEKPHHDSASAINEPVISENTPVEFGNSSGGDNILIQAMQNANLDEIFLNSAVRSKSLGG